MTRCFRVQVFFVPPPTFSLLLTPLKLPGATSTACQVWAGMSCVSQPCALCGRGSEHNGRRRCTRSVGGEGRQLQHRGVDRVHARLRSHARTLHDQLRSLLPSLAHFDHLDHLLVHHEHTARTEAVCGGNDQLVRISRVVRCPSAPSPPSWCAAFFAPALALPVGRCEPRRASEPGPRREPGRGSAAGARQRPRLLLRAGFRRHALSDAGARCVPFSTRGTNWHCLAFPVSERPAQSGCMPWVDARRGPQAPRARVGRRGRDDVTEFVQP